MTLDAAADTSTSSNGGCDSLFLGLDLSTQQLKGILIDVHGRIVGEVNVAFDEQFPDYKTVSGRHAQGDVVTAPVYMWAEAIDALMHELSKTGLAGRIRGISGAAQQHGSVYWTQKGIEKLGSLNCKEGSLKSQLESAGAFALCNSPTWEDSSTGKQCRELEKAAGGAAELARITGSAAFERFTGAQIAKVREAQSEAWSSVARISLVSSFVASLLGGKIAPIDVSDASGTNLLDIQAGKWSKPLCDSIDPNLRNILGLDVVMADNLVGMLSPYYSAKYGIPRCPVVAFTGDNPSAYAGFESLLDALDCSAAILSLGTSDTVQFPLKTYPYLNSSDSSSMEHPDGHVLGHPTAQGQFVTLLCYKNGSLAREWVRDNAPGLDGSWEAFSKMASAPPLAPRAFGFYYLSTEILPKAKGVHRFEQANDGDIVTPTGSRFKRVSSFSANVAAGGGDPRAIIESQLLSMRLDYSHKSKTYPRGAVATGGASANAVLRQAIADVFGIPVYTLGVQAERGFEERTPAMPAYGGAIRALRHCCPTARTPDAGDAGAGSYLLQPACHPCKERHALYTQALLEFEFLRSLVSSH
ncbi:actin-like ATPase domain-containing protein [Martensiomyces pterosporus]|nr:actin-like ATPase domain-containing protein [Martensiomyces pterosporus]